MFSRVALKEGGNWNKIGGVWYNKYTDEAIEVNRNTVGFHNGKYTFEAYTAKRQRKFKTKSQALKFAKSYMRTH